VTALVASRAATDLMHRDRIATEERGMDDVGRPAEELKQPNHQVRTLLGMVERRGLTPDQFYSACTILFADQDSGEALGALIASVDEGQESMASLIAAVTIPYEFEWTADRVIIWVENNEAHARVNLREGRSMRVALTKQGLTAERYGHDHDGPVAALTRTYDELLPAPS